MSPRTAVIGWILAAVFAALAGLFAWQYAQIRRAADKLQLEYDTLQLRVDAQAQQNKEFDETLKSLAQQLEDAKAALEMLDKAVQSAPPPVEAPPAQP